jgi:hypothetical protein
MGDVMLDNTIAGAAFVAYDPVLCHFVYQLKLKDGN